MHVRRPKQVWRAKRGAGCAPESVAHILSGCGALAQSTEVPIPTWLCFEGTFLRDAAWPGTHRWSCTLILPGQTKACIRDGWCTSFLGCASFCSSWRGEMQQRWRSNRQPQDQAFRYPRSELPVGQQQREEERREDCQVCPPTLGIKTAVTK